MELTTRLCTVVAMLIAGFALTAETAHGQIPVAVPVAQPSVVGFVPTRGGLLGLRTVYRPVVAASPVVTASSVTVQPATAFRPAVGSTVISSRPVITSSSTIVTQPFISTPTIVGRPVAPVVTYRLPVVGW